MFAERGSPSVVFLTPPEKLVLEIRTSGPFHYIEWTRNGIRAGQPGFSPVILVQFGEVFVDTSTTAESLGQYDVNLVPPVGLNLVPPTISFVVTSTGL